VASGEVRGVFHDRGRHNTLVWVQQRLNHQRIAFVIKS